MTTIYVTGAGSKEKADDLTRACRFYLGKFGFRMHRKLEVRILLVHQDADGYCDFNDDFTEPEIEITIDKRLSNDERLKALAHEITHAKQFLKKEMKFRNHKVHWKGQPSTNFEWEDEAYIMEDKLYNEYINERPNQRTSNHSI
jgi:hypothetical protein